MIEKTNIVVLSLQRPYIRIDKSIDFVQKRLNGRRYCEVHSTEPPIAYFLV